MSKNWNKKCFIYKKIEITFLFWTEKQKLLLLFFNWIFFLLWSGFFYDISRNFCFGYSFMSKIHILWFGSYATNFLHCCNIWYILWDFFNIFKIFEIFQYFIFLRFSIIFIFSRFLRFLKLCLSLIYIRFQKHG